MTGQAFSTSDSTDELDDLGSTHSTVGPEGRRAGRARDLLPFLQIAGGLGAFGSLIRFPRLRVASLAGPPPH